MSKEQEYNIVDWLDQRNIGSNFMTRLIIAKAIGMEYVGTKEENEELLRQLKELLGEV